MSDFTKPVADTSADDTTLPLVDQVAQMAADLDNLKTVVANQATLGPAFHDLDTKVSAIADEMQAKADKTELGALADANALAASGLKAAIDAIPPGQPGPAGPPGPAAPFGGDATTLLAATKKLRDYMTPYLDGSGQMSEFVRAFKPFADALIAHMPSTDAT